MKRLTQTLAFCLLTVFTAVAQKNYVSEVWVSDLGNGKYKNPVLYADYSDPDACRVGDDFYMTSSSFNCLPGLQILHSKDLVNWTIIGAAVPYALTPIETPERPEHGNRVWAPSIRHHNGEFYIFWGDPPKPRKVRGRNLFWLNREKESSIPARFGMKTEKYIWYTPMQEAAPD